jgi:hypothetical protein
MYWWLIIPGLFLEQWTLGFLMALVWLKLREPFADPFKVALLVLSLLLTTTQQLLNCLNNVMAFDYLTVLYLQSRYFLLLQFKFNYMYLYIIKGYLGYYNNINIKMIEEEFWYLSTESEYCSKF